MQDQTGIEKYQTISVLKNKKVMKNMASYMTMSFDETHIPSGKELQTPSKEQRSLDFKTNLPLRTNRQLKSGGDADRTIYEQSIHNPAETFRRETRSLRDQLQKNKDGSGDSKPIYMNDIFLFDDNSERANTTVLACGQSIKSTKSSNTIASKHSQKLRRIVQSQCKLHDVIDETLKQMCGNDMNTTNINSINEIKIDSSRQLKEPEKQESEQFQFEVPVKAISSIAVCKQCTGKSSTDNRSTETITISVDDVITSKVINPMIRKLQRMYLNNLKEEMSLMEDLERLPIKVSEVYDATVFKKE